MRTHVPSHLELSRIVEDIRNGTDNSRRQIRELLVMGPAAVQELIVRDKTGTIHNFINDQGFMQPRYRDEYPSGPYEYGQGAASVPVSTVILDGEDDGEGNSDLQMRLRTFVRTSANRVVSTTFEMQHDIAFDAANAGTHPVEMHVHYIPLAASTGEQTVVWNLNYAVMNANTVNLTGGANLIQTPITATDTFDVTMEDKQRIVAFHAAALPVPVGGWKIGQLIPVALRLSDTTTYAGNIGFVKIALHVPTDGNGSRQRFIK